MLPLPLLATLPLAALALAASLPSDAAPPLACIAVPLSTFPRDVSETTRLSASRCRAECAASAAMRVAMVNAAGECGCAPDAEFLSEHAALSAAECEACADGPSSEGCDARLRDSEVWRVYALGSDDDNNGNELLDEDARDDLRKRAPAAAPHPPSFFLLGRSDSRPTTTTTTVSLPPSITAAPSTGIDSYQVTAALVTAAAAAAASAGARDVPASGSDAVTETLYFVTVDPRKSTAAAAAGPTGKAGDEDSAAVSAKKAGTAGMGVGIILAAMAVLVV